LIGISVTSASLYNTEFFNMRRAGSRGSAAIAVPILLEQFAPRSVVDVGCGTGAWISVFCEHGVTDVLGIDGSWVDRRILETPVASFREYDLTQPILLDRTFDVALCLEVAEHLPAEVAPVLVNSLTTLAPVIVFSAAIPGQGGRGHINERWPSFWSSSFAAHRFVCFTDLRWRLWVDEGVEYWYRQNMLCFVAESRPDLISRALRGNRRPLTGPLDVVHPHLFLRVGRELEARDREIGKLMSEVEQTKTELAAIQNSRFWHLYQALRPAVAAARHMKSRLRIGARRGQCE
jgi:SAM-dependent methyltransferase